MSQAFYREKLYEKVLGYKDLEDFMVRFWENIFIHKGEKPLARCSEVIFAWVSTHRR